MATYTNSQIQQRIDTENNWSTNNPTIANGEMAISSDKSDFKIGTGSNWTGTAYMIANNPAVTQASTKANNALTAANNAATAASEAQSTANRALAQGGRKEPADTEDPYSGHSNVEITVDNTFIEKYRNYDFESVKGETYLKITISSTNQKYYEYANEIRFHFMTRTTCNIVIPNGTTSISEVDSFNKIMVVQEGNGNLDLTDPTNISIDAGCVVEVRFINTWLVKIVVNKL